MKFLYVFGVLSFLTHSAFGTEIRSGSTDSGCLLELDEILLRLSGIEADDEAVRLLCESLQPGSTPTGSTPTDSDFEPMCFGEDLPFSDVEFDAIPEEASSAARAPSAPARTSSRLAARKRAAPSQPKGAPKPKRASAKTQIPENTLTKEEAAKKEKLRQAAVDFRVRRKGYVEGLERSIEGYEAREIEYSARIAELERRIAEARRSK